MTSAGRVAVAAALGLAGSFGPPAAALEVAPYLRVGADAAWEANISGRESVAAEPLASFFAAGQADVLASALLDAGADVALTEALGVSGSLGARGVGYSRYPALGYVTGNATLQVRLLELPGDLDATVGYGYRDDFLGWRAQWLSATLERPLPWALVAYAAAGADWSRAAVPAGDRSGPFADLGVRRRFRETGTSVRLGLDLAAPAYASGRRDQSASLLCALNQRLARGLYMTGKARLDWVSSSEANRSYAAPAFSVGWAWLLP
ncbi:MAG: hypothetical protein FJZ01_26035 [Candidatus Sericytochromatia bacterium]|nr:hypothetical protein [Candidatus Tanganyikabacteria bacterium]